MNRIRTLSCFLAALLAAASPSAAAPRPHAPEHDWTGSYALRMRVTSITSLPLLGSQRSVTTSLVLATVRRGPRGWMQAHRVCDVRIEGEMKMTLPPAFAASLAPVEFAAEFPDGQAGGVYAGDLGAESIGFDPAATGGAVPRQASQPGVLDSDRDGQPGATVVGHFPLFGSVRIYFAERIHLALRGRQTRPERIEGAVEVRELVQRTLGASNRFFRRSLDIRPDPAGSTFVMVPLPHAATCDDVRRGEATIFR
ncbi:MAG: hypothetical protein JWM27_1289 [Gemmatimonadetes bacterium]|nr:hypothetical protein [Gemmatimonadota bacterium]